MGSERSVGFYLARIWPALCRLVGVQAHGNAPAGGLIGVDAGAKRFIVAEPGREFAGFNLTGLANPINLVFLQARWEGTTMPPMPSEGAQNKGQGNIGFDFHGEGVYPSSAMPIPVPGTFRTVAIDNQGFSRSTVVLTWQVRNIQE